MADTQKQYLHEFDQATTFLWQRDYHSLVDLLKGNPAFALEQGKAVVGLMYYHLYLDKKPFDHGHQLTGDQLQILAYARKAGAAVGEGDVTIHFDYVVRMEPDPDKIEKRYVISFPDLPIILPSFAQQTIKRAEITAKPILIRGIETYMLDGKSLPGPKYALRERSSRVKRREIKLTLADLFEIMIPEDTLER